MENSYSCDCSGCACGDDDGNGDGDDGGGDGDDGSYGDDYDSSAGNMMDMFVLCGNKPQDLVNLVTALIDLFYVLMAVKALFRPVRAWYENVISGGLDYLSALVQLKQDAFDILDFLKLLFVSRHPHVDQDQDQESHEKDNCCCQPGAKSGARHAGHGASTDDHNGWHPLKSTRCLAITLFIIFTFPSITGFLFALSDSAGEFVDPTDKPPGYKRFSAALENVGLVTGPFLDLFDAFFSVISLLSLHYLGSRLFVTNKYLGLHMARDEDAKTPPDPSTPQGAKRRPSRLEHQHMEEVVNDMVGHDFPNDMYQKVMWKNIVSIRKSGCWETLIMWLAIFFLAVPWGSVSTILTVKKNQAEEEGDSSAAVLLSIVVYIMKLQKAYISGREPNGVLDDCLSAFVMHGCGSIESVCNYARRCWPCEGILSFGLGFCYWACCLWGCDQTSDCNLCCRVCVKSTALFAFLGALAGFAFGALFTFPVLGCKGFQDPDNEMLGNVPLIFTIIIMVFLCLKGGMYGCKRSQRVTVPKLNHSAMVMTGASNWVVITYELPKKPASCLNKCLSEDRKRPDLATIVLPLKNPSIFIDQATRAAWMAQGLQSEYVAKRGNMYKFNSKFQDQTLTSLKHGAPVEVQPLMTRVSEAAEESMADGDDYTAGDDALAHEIDEEEAPDEPEDEDEYGMDELGGLLLDVGPKSNTIALDFSQYLRVLEARKEEQRLIRAKVFEHDVHEAEAQELNEPEHDPIAPYPSAMVVGKQEPPAAVGAADGGTEVEVGWFSNTFNGVWILGGDEVKPQVAEVELVRGTEL